MFDEQTEITGAPLDTGCMTINAGEDAACRSIELPSPLTRTVDIFGQAIPVWLLLVGAAVAVVALNSKK